jgi:type I restriction enzyme S subunit
MSGLISKPLGEIAILQAGVGFPLGLQGRKSGDYPLAKVGDISRVSRSGQSILSSADHYVDTKDLDCLNAKPIPAGSILFPKIGMAIRLNHRVVAGCPLLIDNNAMAAIPKHPVESRYLFHFLRTVDLFSYTSATTVPSLRKSDLERLQVPLPSLPEQRRIAEILDRADALRAKRRAALALLDVLAQSIFFEMFGDPAANPKGWPNPSVGGVLTFQQYGPRFFNEPYSTEGIRIVRITDLDEEGVLDFSSMPMLDIPEEDREKYVLRSGDLIFARSGATVGKTALIQSGSPPCIAGAYFITLRFDSRVDPCYARAVLSSPSIRSIVAIRSRQAAQQNFSGPGLRQLPMPCPPLEMQREFAYRIETIRAMKSTQLASLAMIESLFASLQHRAFRGEL